MKTIETETERKSFRYEGSRGRKEKAQRKKMNYKREVQHSQGNIEKEQQEGRTKMRRE